MLSPATGCTTFARNGRASANEGKSSFNISLSPNPSSNRFTLVAQSNNHLQAVNIRVVDVNGKVVYETKGQPEQSFRFGERFSNGMYLIEVRQGDELKTIKAVKGK